MIRVVLDTNNLVSAALSLDGNEAEVVRAISLVHPDACVADEVTNARALLERLASRL